MELRQLAYVAAVARHRHFTRAAEELHVAQSALSQQVRRLEAELGVELFTRTSRRVELTEAGELVVARAGRVLGEVEALQGDLDRLGGLVRGRLRIGGMPVLGPLDFAGLLADFRALHPGVEIRVREDPLDRTLARLHRDELDAAFASIAGDGVPAELACQELATEELVLIAAPGSAPARRKRVQLRTLAGEPFIAFQEGSALRRTVDRALAAAGVAPDHAFESNELPTVRSLAARGLGCSIVPQSFAEMPGPEVVALPITPRIERPISLLWRAGRRLPPAAEAFVAFVRRASV